MKIQKQLLRHDPNNGVFGDCHRTAIACVLDMDAADVPHFMGDKAEWDMGNSERAHDRVEEWLNARGMTQISVAFPGSLDLDTLLKCVAMNCYGSACLLGGTSKNGCGHTVVCLGGKIVCDPSQDESGVVGPMSDGHYWVTFFGSTRALGDKSRLGPIGGDIPLIFTVKVAGVECGEGWPAEETFYIPKVTDELDEGIASAILRTVEEEKEQ